MMVKKIQLSKILKWLSERSVLNSEFFCQHERKRGSQMHLPSNRRKPKGVVFFTEGLFRKITAVR
jgi:hypothetical protein